METLDIYIFLAYLKYIARITFDKERNWVVRWFNLIFIFSYLNSSMKSFLHLQHILRLEHKANNLIIKNKKPL